MIKRCIAYVLVLFSILIFSSVFYSLNRAWTYSVIATIPIGNSPRGIAYDSGNKEMYISNSGSNTISVIDTSNYTVVATITVESFPIGVAYDQDNKRRM